MISTSAILPLLSLIKWPATLTGAILVFGLSTDGTLSLISSNAHKFTKPVAVSNDFNMPPVRQIADLDPMTIVPATPSDKSDAVALPQMQTTTVALRQPEAVTLVTPIAIEQTNLPLGRIGDSAVNMRSGPSKTSAKLGTLAAGTEVQIGEVDRGWVYVQHAGGEGWIYSSYLASQAGIATTALNSSEDARPSKGKAVEVGSRMTARSSPSSDAPSIFRIAAGERVKILERRGNWLQVTTVSGDTGWIRAKG